MKLLLGCAIAIFASRSVHAQSVTVFQTGFEPVDGYNLGSLIGQNGWIDYLGEDLNFGRVVNSNVLAGTQSVLLDGLDVQLGTFGNYAGAGRLLSVAPTMSGAPLRYLETTCRMAILDPTIVVTHHSNLWMQYYNGFLTAVGGCAAGSRFGDHVFGFPINGGPNPMVSVTPSVAFTARNVLDYKTGLASAWKDGQVVFQDFDNGLTSTLIADQFWLEAVAINNQPFDTRVWIDELAIRAVYGCAADTNQDFTVNVTDLLAVIGAWGSCPAPPAHCPGDVSGDTIVNVTDLLAVIGEWGSCE